MAINFPSTPTVGQTFVIGTKVYTWDGTRWTFDFRNIVKGTTAERPTVDKPFVYYNTTLRVYEVWRPEYSVWEALLSYPIQETLIDPTIAYSEASYTTPGTYQWECPAGVAYVHVVCVGGGSGGNSTVGSSSSYYGDTCGGTGGGLGWKNNIPVTPGNLYTVQVGAGGISKYQLSGVSASTNGGGDSYFINSSTVAGFGGAAGLTYNDRAGGGYVGDGGGAGGDSRGAYPSGISSQPGAGAGGYSGKGGDAAWYNGTTWIFSTAGAGGGGGGGGSYSATSNYPGAAGGGVGLLGEGASGAVGSNSSSPTPGGGGSGAVTSTVVGDLQGGSYGGGAGSYVGVGTTSQNGGGGAVRIIWGAGRAFPSTNTGVI